MSQNLSAVFLALIPKTWFGGTGVTKQSGPINADPNGSLVVSGIGGTNSSLYMNGSTPIIAKAGPGMVCRMNVIVAGSAGAIYDCTATANAVTANEVAVIPATVGPIALEFPCKVGIVVQLGASQVISLSYQ
jgi:hypothetical protein